MLYFTVLFVDRNPAFCRISNKLALRQVKREEETMNSNSNTAGASSTAHIVLDSIDWPRDSNPGQPTSDGHAPGCSCETCEEFASRPTLVMNPLPSAEPTITISDEDDWGAFDDIDDTDDEGFRSALGDEGPSTHREGCTCSTCFEREQQFEEADSAYEGYEQIMCQSNPETILRDLLALRQNIAQGEHMEVIRDTINEGIDATRRRVEVLRAEETPDSLLLFPIYVDSGNEEWLDSLFVSEEDPDTDSDRYKYAAVDSTVDELRFSSRAAEEAINSKSSGNLMDELKKFVWICKAYRLTIGQLMQIKQTIRIIRIELRRQEELDIILREKEQERMENAHFEALYAPQEETAREELRRRITVKANTETRGRRRDGKLKRRASKDRSEQIAKPRKMERRRERMLASEATM